MERDVFSVQRQCVANTRTNHCTNTWKLERRRLIGLLAAVGVTLLVGRGVSQATDVSGACPPGGFTAAESPWNLTGTVTIGDSETCVIEPGVEIFGNGSPLIVAAGGTLTAVGTSAEQRDVLLDGTYVQFNGPSGPTPAGTGTLENCTIAAPRFSNSWAIFITDASPTVRNCTITNDGTFGGVGGISIAGNLQLSPAEPLISENDITAPGLGIDVGGAARPTLTGNVITTNGLGISYAGNARGMATGNDIFFVPFGGNHVGIGVQGNAAPVINGNTIFDDPSSAETAISLTVNPGVAVEVTNNTIHVSTTNDTPLFLAPDVFGPGPTISGNMFPEGVGGGFAVTGTLTSTVTVEALEGQTSFRLGGVTVAAGTELTIAPGITLNGQSSGLVVAAGGTLTAVGTSADERDVMLNGVFVQFNGPSGPTPAGTGTLENCTIVGPAFGGSRAISITDASPTVRRCSISGSERGISIGGGLQLTPAEPLIVENDIGIVLVGIEVNGTARPELMGNTITVNGAGGPGIAYSGSAGGTASGNTIDFVAEGSGNRIGVSVQENAAPVISDNMINDDPTRGDTAISVTVNPGVAVQVTGNTIHVSSANDRALFVAPDVFAPGPTISDNLFPEGFGGGIGVSGTLTSSVVLGPLEGQTSYLTDGITVQGQLTIAPGITLNGQGSALVVAAGGTLTAVGTSADERDVMLNGVFVQFEAPSGPTSAGTGTLENCTIVGPGFGGSRAIRIFDASPTVRRCSISGSEGGILVRGELQLTPAEPLIVENDIGIVSIGIDVNGTARPMLMGNTITVDGGGGAGINYSGNARGTATGNTIDFVLKGTGNRIGFLVQQSAEPLISGNEIGGDPTRTDTGIFLTVPAGNLVQVVANDVCAAGADVCIGIDSSQGFVPTAEQIRENTNSCGGSPCFGTAANTATPTTTPTSIQTETPTATSSATATPTTTPSTTLAATPTPTPTVTGTPAFLTITGSCHVPGPGGLEACPAGIAVSAFRCIDASCDDLDDVGRGAIDDQGNFAIGIGDTDVAGARLIIVAEVGGGGGGGTAAGAQAATVYRVIAFGPIIGGRLAVEISPTSEATVRLLEENGLANYRDSRVTGVGTAVSDANAATSFADDTLDGAVDRARETATADPIVQARLACPIDCDLNRTVSAAELVAAVNRALGHSAVGVCEAADGNGDGAVSIDEMVDGVRGSTAGCFTE